MNIRIISGSLRGRRIQIHRSAGAFRPTSQRVREAVAESIAGSISGAVVADICAGSGAFGFEMLSRGARTVDFVERDAARAADISRHARKFGVEGQCRIIVHDAARFVRSQSIARYNIIFYDPPYDDDELAWMTPEIVRLTAPSGICIVEHPHGRDIGSMMEKVGMFSVRSRRYGGSEVSYITRRCGNAPCGAQSSGEAACR